MNMKTGHSTNLNPGNGYCAFGLIYIMVLTWFVLKCLNTYRISVSPSSRFSTV